MSYIKRTWVDGEDISDDKLNNIETGISEAKKAAEQNGIIAGEAKETANSAKSAADAAASAANTAKSAADAAASAADSAQRTANEAKATADKTSKIAKGSYVGTGTVDTLNPGEMSLTFDFVPQMLIIIGIGKNTNSKEIKSFYGWTGGSMLSISRGTSSGEANFTTIAVSVDGTTVSWVAYATYANETGVTYNYIAIG